MPSPGPNNASAVERSYAAYGIDMAASAKAEMAESTKLRTSRWTKGVVDLS